MWTLDYDGSMTLRLPSEELEALSSSSFYKLSLKRYAAEIADGIMRFKPALTYLDYKKIIALCQKEAVRRQTELVVSESLRAYIDSRELHLEIRSRLGSELKDRDPKLRERFEAYRDTVNAGMARKLREQQMWDSFFMCAMKKSANFSVPGSGKTASVLGMYAYLREKAAMHRIVVVCPKNAFGSWMDEFSACFAGIEPLRVLNIHAPQYKTQQQRRAALQYDAGGCNLILVNYEAVGGVLDALEQLMDAGTLLVFDEVHKVKRIRGEYAENALQLARNARYVVALTGTPIPNAYTDIYNLLHILFPNEYDEFFGFTVPQLRNPRDTDIAAVNTALQPFFCRTTKEQLGVPAANADMVLQVGASDTENRLLRILQMKYRKNKLALLVRILQLESDPRMLLQALDLNDFRYLLDDTAETSEIDYADYSDEVRSLIDNCEESSKFCRCIELTEKLVRQNKPVIVWCMFVGSIRRMADALEARGIRCRCVFGEVPLEERQQILNDFRAGGIQVLLTNPHTLAESVSLHSVCHDAIYFEYSYNLVHLLQSKDRIHRLGLPEGQYTQYYYLQLTYQTEDGAWSLDGAVYDRLREKERIMLEAIDCQRLERMPTSEEDLDTIFGGLF